MVRVALPVVAPPLLVAVRAIPPQQDLHLELAVVLSAQPEREPLEMVELLISRGRLL